MKIAGALRITYSNALKKTANFMTIDIIDSNYEH